MLSLDNSGNLGVGSAGAIGRETYYQRTTVEDRAACGLPGLPHEATSAGVTYAVGLNAPSDLRDGVQLTREDIRSMLRGEWRYGAVQNAHAPDRFMGVDAAFSGPKDVCVVWAARDREGRTAIESCQHDAARHSYENVLAPALYSRRGHGGAERVAVISFPTFYGQHLSRADDPDLHTHMLGASYGLRQDGTVGTIEFDHWYGLAHLADANYLLTLSNLLRERAGIDLVMAQDGKLRVVGVDSRLAEEFSRRTREMIERYEAVYGKGSWEQATAAEREAWAVRTRPKHNRSFREDFLERARAAGLEAEFIAAGRLRSAARSFTAEGRAAALATHVRDAAHDQVHGGYSFASHAEIPGDAWVEERKIFAEAAFRAAGTGATMEDVRTAVERAIERGEIIRHAKEGADGPWTAPLSTPQQMEREQRVVADLERLARGRTVPVPEGVVCEEIAKWERSYGHRLTPDQERAVVAATSGRRAVILIGAAGAGKTVVAEIIASCHRRMGREVVGEAPTGKARLELIEGAKIHAVTHDAAMARGRQWGPKTVALADEAGFASAVHAESLHTAALASGAVLIKSGDPLQLQPVGPGATFRHEIQALQRIDPQAVVVLSEVRRQRDPEVRMIAETAAKGWPGDALVAVYEAGRLQVHGEHRDAVRAASTDVARWIIEGTDAQAIVPTRRDADLANRAVREALRERGLLPREEITYKSHVDPRTFSGPASTEHIVTMLDGKAIRETGLTSGWAPRTRPWEREVELAVGDRVSFTENRYDLGVQNGSPGKVVGFSPRGDVSIRLDDRWGRVDRDGWPIAHRQTVYGVDGTPCVLEGREAAQHVTVPAHEVARPTHDGRYTFVTHDYARTGQRVQGGEAETVSVATGLSSKQLSAQWANTALTRGVADLRVHLSSQDLRGPTLEGAAALDPHGHGERQAIHRIVMRDPERPTLRAAEVASRAVDHARERVQKAEAAADRARESLERRRAAQSQAKDRLERAERRLEHVQRGLERARLGTDQTRAGSTGDRQANAQEPPWQARGAASEQRAQKQVEQAERRVDRARTQVEHARGQVAKAETRVVNAERRVAKADAAYGQAKERLARAEQRHKALGKRLHEARVSQRDRGRTGGRGNGDIGIAQARRGAERDIVSRAAERANQAAFGRTNLDFLRRSEWEFGREKGTVQDRGEHRPPHLDRGLDREQEHGMAR